MAIKLQLIKQTERPILERMFQLYLHDMSEFMGWAIGNEGAFTYPVELLPPYWSRDDHWPYFAFSGDTLVGFVMVRAAPDNPKVFDMGQFFLLRAYRSAGFGGEMLRQCVVMHPGRWQIRVLGDNTAARAFWTSAVAKVAASTVDVSQESYGEHEMIYFRFKTE